MSATLPIDRTLQNTDKQTDYTSLERLTKNKFAMDFAARKVWLRCLVAILLIAGLSFASISLSRPKFNRSEIAYAEISKEMLSKSSFIVPLYRGIPCIDKPVLNYWAIIPCFKAFGASGWSSRIPSLVAALLSLGIFAVVIRKLFGWQASLLSTMILATAQRFWEFATLCMTDMLLTLFEGSALVLLYAGLKNEKNRLLYFAGAAVSMGLGTLTKGPVALILPSFAFLTYIALTKRLRILSIANVVVPAIVFFAVAAPWYIAAQKEVTTSADVLAWLLNHNAGRFFGDAYAYHYSPFYMVASLFLGFAPWSIFLPFAAASSIKKWISKENPAESQQELYLWIWLVLTTTFFTISHGKMNYYDLPAFPAAAGIVGLYLANSLNNKRAIGIIGAGILSMALFVGAVGSFVILPGVSGSSDPLRWIAMPLTLGICALVAAVALIKQKPFISYAAIFAGFCGALICFGNQIAPAMAKQAPAIVYIQIFKEHPEARLAMHADFANTVDWFDFALFQTGRAPEELKTTEDLAAFLEQPGKALVIVPESRFKQLPHDTHFRARTLERRLYMDKKVDLGLLLKNRGKLTGTVPLLLVSN